MTSGLSAGWLSYLGVSRRAVKQQPGTDAAPAVSSGRAARGLRLVLGAGARPMGWPAAPDWALGVAQGFSHEFCADLTRHREHRPS